MNQTPSLQPKTIPIPFLADAGGEVGARVRKKAKAEARGSKRNPGPKTLNPKTLSAKTLKPSTLEP